MNDLFLDPYTEDLAIDDFELSIVKGADRVRQNLSIKLNLWRGEWFLDTEFGTPYLENFLGKQITLNGAIAALKQSIMEVSDVERITRMEYNFDRRNRKLVIDFDCATPFGIVTGPRPVSRSPALEGLERAGLTSAQFVVQEEKLDTLINETIPSHNY